MRGLYIDKFIAFLMLLLIVFAIFLQVSTNKSTDKLKNDEIIKSGQYAQKIVRLIALRTKGNLEKSLTESSTLQIQLNEVLQAFLTQQYRYIFLLNQDETGHYRFLLDGSKDNPEEYKSIFFPKSKLFDKVYKDGVISIVEQHGGVEEVWVSLVYPFKEKGKTAGLLVLDLSKEYANYLNHFNSPLVRVIKFMQIFLIFSLLFLLVLAYRYYKARTILIKDSHTGAYTKSYLREFFDKYNIEDYYVILIDIDEFKEVNKKYGEGFGDMLIKLFVSRLKEYLTIDSKIIRRGGTEFLVVVPKKKNTIETLAKTLFFILKEKAYSIDNESIQINISMSAINTPKDATSIQNVLRFLDEALLKIKSEGKNAFKILGVENYDEMKYSDIDYIKEALEEERLTCLYQPIYATKSKRIVKYEALVRLKDKQNPEKLIPPVHFMHVIKSTSQYIKMSKLVLSKVIHTLEKYSNIEISINLDLDDLYNIDMMLLINEYLEKHQEIAHRLTFEILEENEIKDYDRVSAIFTELRKYGSKIAIDDFGSGYANYSYLIQLDIDILKIDGTLIHAYYNEPERTKEVLKSIQKLASIFKYEIVAEFVSDEIIYDYINELGIDYVQGLYLGEPRPINEYLS